MANLKAQKLILSQFMKLHYSDERLAYLLAHAEDGKLSFSSCCCFIGSVNANHRLRGFSLLIDVATCLPKGAPDIVFAQHYRDAKKLPGADEAEDAFASLGWTDEERRMQLIPMIRKELRRRERQQAFDESNKKQTVGG